MREILLLSGADDAYDRSVVFLAITQAPLSNPRSAEIARAPIDRGRCAVLVLR